METARAAEWIATVSERRSGASNARGRTAAPGSFSRGSGVESAAAHSSIGGNAATGTAGTARGRSGIASMAAVTDAHTAWRTAAARVRVTNRITAASAAAIVARSDASARMLHKARAASVHMAYRLFLTLRASFRISSNDSTFSSTIPSRNRSADPDQNRLMICRMTPAATLCGGSAAS